jgi:hypothetical protein
MKELHNLVKQVVEAPIDYVDNPGPMDYKDRAEASYDAMGAMADRLDIGDQFYECAPDAAECPRAFSNMAWVKKFNRVITKAHPNQEESDE